MDRKKPEPGKTLSLVVIFTQSIQLSIIVRCAFGLTAAYSYSL